MEELTEHNAPSQPCLNSAYSLICLQTTQSKNLVSLSAILIVLVVCTKSAINGNQKCWEKLDITIIEN